MAESRVNRRFDNHFGIDLKSDDLNRDERFSSSLLNTQNRKSGAVELRPGFHIHGDTFGGMGLTTYNRTNPTTGIEEPIKVAFGRNPAKAAQATLTVSYNAALPGATAPVMVSILFDPPTAQYRCQILEGTGLVLDMALGLGYDTLTPVTLASLQAAINALTGFTATVNGADSTPAAFLKIVRDYDLLGSEGPLEAVAEYWVPLNTTVTNPFNNAYLARNSDEFENASSVQINNCLYVGNGYDETHKYDGQTFYRAGVPTPASLAAAVSVGAGAITGDNYRYIAHYTQIDAVGQLIEGNIIISNMIAGTTTAKNFNVTVANVLQGSGFNTNCAISALLQGPTNLLNVTNGSGGAHSLQVGDTAYFYDSVSATYVERLVTAITPSSITVAGSPVIVASLAVISNNLRIAVYRSKTSGSTPTAYYFLAELPNNSYAATQTQVDSTIDSALGFQYVTPASDRSCPPKANYLATFRNRLVLTGTRTYNPVPQGATVSTGVTNTQLLLSPNTVAISDVDGPEYVPNDGSTSFECNSEAGDPNTGAAEHNSQLNAFKNSAIFAASADAEGNITSVERIPGNIGCVAHATIHRSSSFLYFVDGTKGPHAMIGGQEPFPLGAVEVGKEKHGRIEPVFDQRGVPSERRLILKKAVAVNHTASDKYILFLPAETTMGSGDKYANSYSRLFAYDYSRDAWYEWSNMNMLAGACTVGSELFWQERRLSPVFGTITSYLYRQHNLNDAWDYEDNHEPIGGTDLGNWHYGGAWDFLQHPSVLKRWLWLKLYSLEETPNNSFAVNVKTEVNFIKDVAKSIFQFTGVGGGYGIDAYGSEPYGSPADNDPEHKLGPGRFKAMRPVFYGDGEHQQNIIISGWETEVVTPYKLQIKE